LGYCKPRTISETGPPLALKKHGYCRAGSGVGERPAGQDADGEAWDHPGGEAAKASRKPWSVPYCLIVYGGTSTHKSAPVPGAQKKRPPEGGRLLQLYCYVLIDLGSIRSCGPCRLRSQSRPHQRQRRWGQG
jgi:hypothetical protein